MKFELPRSVGPIAGLVLAAGIGTVHGGCAKRDRMTRTDEVGPALGTPPASEAQPAASAQALSAPGADETGSQDYRSFTEWYGNGYKKIEGQFRNGQRDGTWTYYSSSNGNIVRVEEYRDGELIGTSPF